MSKVRWGIVGPGHIAHKFAHDIQFTQHAELKAVASNNIGRGEEFASKYNIPRVYDSYQKLYEDSDIDAVYVATPHSFHFQNSADALRAGKAVLCEKPMTPSVEETTELINIANQTGMYLMEGMWTYFLPAIKQAQKWVEEGRLGKICHIKSDFGFQAPYDEKGRLFNPDLAGGSILDVGIYTIAIANLFLKKTATDMNVIASKAITGVDDDVVMLFNYSDATASLHSSIRYKLNNWAYVIGEKGYIAIPNFWMAKESFLYVGEEKVEHFKDSSEGFGFNFETEAVSQDILNGKKQSDIVPYKVSSELMSQMDRVMKMF